MEQGQETKFPLHEAARQGQSGFQILSFAFCWTFFDSLLRTCFQLSALYIMKSTVIEKEEKERNEGMGFSTMIRDWKSLARRDLSLG